MSKTLLRHTLINNIFDMKDTTNTQMSASYIDLHIEIDRWGRGELKTKLYDKCDDFTFTSNFKKNLLSEGAIIFLY
jgi:hypothetical protein